MNIEDYLSKKIVKVQTGRLIGVIIWTMGSCVSLAGLSFGILFLVILGFSMLFGGSILSLHFELRRIDYAFFLEQLSNRDQ